MVTGILVFLTVFSINEREFLDTATAQQNQGFSWGQIECRAPDESLPHIAIETPIGNKYVCFKLEK